MFHKVLKPCHLLLIIDVLASSILDLIMASSNVSISVPVLPAMLSTFLTKVSLFVIPSIVVINLLFLLNLKFTLFSGLSLGITFACDIVLCCFKNS